MTKQDDLKKKISQLLTSNNKNRFIFAPNSKSPKVCMLITNYERQYIFLLTERMAFIMAKILKDKSLRNELQDSIILYDKYSNRSFQVHQLPLTYTVFPEKINAFVCGFSFQKPRYHNNLTDQAVVAHFKSVLHDNSHAHILRKDLTVVIESIKVKEWSKRSSPVSEEDKVEKYCWIDINKKMKSMKFSPFKSNFKKSTLLNARTDSCVWLNDVKLNMYGNTPRNNNMKKFGAHTISEVSSLTEWSCSEYSKSFNIVIPPKKKTKSNKMRLRLTKKSAFKRKPISVTVAPAANNDKNDLDLIYSTNKTSIRSKQESFKLHGERSIKIRKIDMPIKQSLKCNNIHSNKKIPISSVEIEDFCLQSPLNEEIPKCNYEGEKLEEFFERIRVYDQIKRKLSIYQGINRRKPNNLYEKKETVIPSVCLKKNNSFLHYATYMSNNNAVTNGLLFTSSKSIENISVQNESTENTDSRAIDQIRDIFTENRNKWKHLYAYHSNNNNKDGNKEKYAKENLNNEIRNCRFSKSKKIKINKVTRNPIRSYAEKTPLKIVKNPFGKIPRNNLMKKATQSKLPNKDSFTNAINCPTDDFKLVFTSLKPSNLSSEANSSNAFLITRTAESTTTHSSDEEDTLSNVASINSLDEEYMLSLVQSPSRKVRIGREQTQASDPPLTVLREIIQDSLEKPKKNVQYVPLNRNPIALDEEKPSRVIAACYEDSAAQFSVESTEVTSIKKKIVRQKAFRNKRHSTIFKTASSSRRRSDTNSMDNSSNAMFIQNPIFDLNDGRNFILHANSKSKNVEVVNAFGSEIKPFATSNSIEIFDDKVQDLKINLEDMKNKGITRVSAGNYSVLLDKYTNDVEIRKSDLTKYEPDERSLKSYYSYAIFPHSDYAFVGYGDKIRAPMKNSSLCKSKASYSLASLYPADYLVYPKVVACPFSIPATEKSKICDRNILLSSEEMPVSKNIYYRSPDKILKPFTDEQTQCDNFDQNNSSDSLDTINSWKDDEFFLKSHSTDSSDFQQEIYTLDKGTQKEDAGGDQIGMKLVRDSFMDVKSETNNLGFLKHIKSKMFRGAKRVGRHCFMCTNSCLLSTNNCIMRCFDDRLEQKQISELPLCVGDMSPIDYNKALVMLEQMSPEAVKLYRQKLIEYAVKYDRLGCAKQTCSKSVQNECHGNFQELDSSECSNVLQDFVTKSETTKFTLADLKTETGSSHDKKKGFATNVYFVPELVNNERKVFPTYFRFSGSEMDCNYSSDRTSCFEDDNAFTQCDIAVMTDKNFIPDYKLNGQTNALKDFFLSELINKISTFNNQSIENKNGDVNSWEVPEIDLVEHDEKNVRILGPFGYFINSSTIPASCGLLTCKNGLEVRKHEIFDCENLDTVCETKCNYIVKKYKILNDGILLHLKPINHESIETLSDDCNFGRNHCLVTNPLSEKKLAADMKIITRKSCLKERSKIKKTNDSNKRKSSVILLLPDENDPNKCNDFEEKIVLSKSAQGRPERKSKHKNSLVKQNLTSYRSGTSSACNKVENYEANKLHHAIDDIKSSEVFENIPPFDETQRYRNKIRNQSDAINSMMETENKTLEKKFSYDSTNDRKFIENIHSSLDEDSDAWKDIVPFVFQPGELKSPLGEEYHEKPRATNNSSNDRIAAIRSVSSDISIETTTEESCNQQVTNGCYEKQETEFSQLCKFKVQLGNSNQKVYLEENIFSDCDGSILNPNLNRYNCKQQKELFECKNSDHVSILVPHEMFDDLFNQRFSKNGLTGASSEDVICSKEQRKILFDIMEQLKEINEQNVLRNDEYAELRNRIEQLQRYDSLEDAMTLEQVRASVEMQRISSEESKTKLQKMHNDLELMRHEVKLVKDKLQTLEYSANVKMDELYDDVGVVENNIIQYYDDKLHHFKGEVSKALNKNKKSLEREFRSSLVIPLVKQMEEIRNSTSFEKVAEDDIDNDKAKKPAVYNIDNLTINNSEKYDTRPSMEPNLFKYPVEQVNVMCMTESHGERSINDIVNKNIFQHDAQSEGKEMLESFKEMTFVSTEKNKSSSVTNCITNVVKENRIDEPLKEASNHVCEGLKYVSANGNLLNIDAIELHCEELHSTENSYENSKKIKIPIEDTQTIIGEKASLDNPVLNKVGVNIFNGIMKNLKKDKISSQQSTVKYDFKPQREKSNHCVAREFSFNKNGEEDISLCDSFYQKSARVSNEEIDFVNLLSMYCIMSVSDDCPFKLPFMEYLRIHAQKTFFYSNRKDTESVFNDSSSSSLDKEEITKQAIYLDIQTALIKVFPRNQIMPNVLGNGINFDLSFMGLESIQEMCALCGLILVDKIHELLQMVQYLVDISAEFNLEDDIHENLRNFLIFWKLHDTNSIETRQIISNAVVQDFVDLLVDSIKKCLCESKNSERISEVLQNNFDCFNKKLVDNTLINYYISVKNLYYFYKYNNDEFDIDGSFQVYRLTDENEDVNKNSDLVNMDLHLKNKILLQDLFKTNCSNIKILEKSTSLLDSTFNDTTTSLLSSLPVDTSPLKINPWINLKIENKCVESDLHSKSKLNPSALPNNLDNTKEFYKSALLKNKCMHSEGQINDFELSKGVTALIGTPLPTRTQNLNNASQMNIIRERRMFKKPMFIAVISPVEVYSHHPFYAGEKNDHVDISMENNIIRRMKYLLISSSTVVNILSNWRPVCVTSINDYHLYCEEIRKAFMNDFQMSIMTNNPILNDSLGSTMNNFNAISKVSQCNGEPYDQNSVFQMSNIKNQVEGQISLINFYNCEYDYANGIIVLKYILQPLQVFMNGISDQHIKSFQLDQPLKCKLERIIKNANENNYAQISTNFTEFASTNFTIHGELELAVNNELNNPNINMPKLERTVRSLALLLNEKNPEHISYMCEESRRNSDDTSDAIDNPLENITSVTSSSKRPYKKVVKKKRSKIPSNYFTTKQMNQRQPSLSILPNQSSFEPITKHKRSKKTIQFADEVETQKSDFCDSYTDPDKSTLPKVALKPSLKKSNLKDSSNVFSREYLTRVIASPDGSYVPMDDKIEKSTTSKSFLDVKTNSNIAEKEIYKYVKLRKTKHSKSKKSPKVCLTEKSWNSLGLSSSSKSKIESILSSYKKYDDENFLENMTASQSSNNKCKLFKIRDRMNTNGNNSKIEVTVQSKKQMLPYILVLKCDYNSALEIRKITREQENLSGKQNVINTMSNNSVQQTTCSLSLSGNKTFLMTNNSRKVSNIKSQKSTKNTSSLFINKQENKNKLHKPNLPFKGSLQMIANSKLLNKQKCSLKKDKKRLRGQSPSPFIDLSSDNCYQEISRDMSVEAEECEPTLHHLQADDTQTTDRIPLPISDIDVPDKSQDIANTYRRSILKNLKHKKKFTYPEEMNENPSTLPLPEPRSIRKDMEITGFSFSTCSNPLTNNMAEDAVKPYFAAIMHDGTVFCSLLNDGLRREENKASLQSLNKLKDNDPFPSLTRASLKMGDSMEGNTVVPFNNHSDSGQEKSFLKDSVEVLKSCKDDSLLWKKNHAAHEKTKIPFRRMMKQINSLSDNEMKISETIEPSEEDKQSSHKNVKFLLNKESLEDANKMPYVKRKKHGDSSVHFHISENSMSDCNSEYKRHYISKLLPLIPLVKQKEIKINKMRRINKDYNPPAPPMRKKSVINKIQFEAKDVPTKVPKQPKSITVTHLQRRNVRHRLNRSYCMQNRRCNRAADNSSPFQWERSNLTNQDTYKSSKRKMGVIKGDLSTLDLRGDTSHKEPRSILNDTNTYCLSSPKIIAPMRRIRDRNNETKLIFKSVNRLPDSKLKYDSVNLPRNVTVSGKNNEVTKGHRRVRLHSSGTKSPVRWR